MCGIAGVVSNGLDHNEIHKCLQCANNIQNHRGPDAQGIHIEDKAPYKVGLAHQRLSILDLTDAGNQPMNAFNGQSYIVYNGEVYNYLEIRRELQELGYSFRSNSDTEVVITALQHWGIENALNRFNGMWALAWLNIKENKLYLARDRFGVKPLYYSLNKKGLFFASEIKTILEMTQQRYSLDYQVVGEYLQQSLAESSDKTFFQGIDKIPAGSYAEIDLNSQSSLFNLHQYYDLKNNLEDKELQVVDGDLIEQVRELFFSAVSLRLRSDVPLGVLLSGGIDSSSIAAVIPKTEDIQLLSAVSQDKRFDESPFIDIMARHLNLPVNKVTLDLGADQAFALLDKVCWHNDEPVGSFSNVAHYLLMEQAKELGVTVILSGQGADELLCGYRKYLGFYIQEMLRKSDYKGVIGNIAQFMFNGTVINQFSLAEAGRYLPKRMRPRVPNINGDALADFEPQLVGLAPGMDVRARQISDVYKYSVPILTHFEDRMSMAWSREVRVPFLDYRLVELLINLPINMKLNRGWTKYIFRKALEPYLPKAVIWRKDKQGFINPQSEWLKNSLKPNVLDYFQEGSLIFKYGLVKRDQLLELYGRYCRQKPNRGQVWFKDIFNPLALEIWLRQNERHIS